MCLLYGPKLYAYVLIWIYVKIIISRKIIAHITHTQGMQSVWKTLSGSGLRLRCQSVYFTTFSFHNQQIFWITVNFLASRDTKAFTFLSIPPLVTLVLALALTLTVGWNMPAVVMTPWKNEEKIVPQPQNVGIAMLKYDSFCVCVCVCGVWVICFPSSVSDLPKQLFIDTAFIFILRWVFKLFLLAFLHRFKFKNQFII